MVSVFLTDRLPFARLMSARISVGYECSLTVNGKDLRRVALAQLMMTAVYVNDLPSILKEQLEQVFISHRVAPSMQ